MWAPWGLQGGPFTSNPGPKAHQATGTLIFRGRGRCRAISDDLVQALSLPSGSGDSTLQVHLSPASISSFTPVPAGGWPAGGIASCWRETTLLGPPVDVQTSWCWRPPCEEQRPYDPLKAPTHQQLFPATRPIGLC